MHLIRKFQTTDSLLEMTALLHLAYARLGAMGLNYTALDQTAEITAKRIAQGHCYVGKLDGELVGTILVTPTFAENPCQYFTRAGVASVHQFAVDPARQGKGIGRALLRACESWAVNSGFQELALDTAEPAKHLVRLYTNLGYRHVDYVQWPGKVYRSVVLSKILCPHTERAQSRGDLI